MKKIVLNLTIALALLAPNHIFSQEQTSADNRSEVNYKQRHSNLNPMGLFADGIKIKRDLSILQELQEARILEEEEAQMEEEYPANDLYGGIWTNQYVHKIYNSVSNVPDTFKVNLNNFTMPISGGHVTSNFGMRRRRMHNGIDLKVQVGDTIYAAFDGKVRVKKFERRGYGYYLTIRHPNGLETTYGHLSKFLVQENETVKSGDPIALGGNTGRSTGSHLHFELRFLGKAINPIEIVDFENFVTHRDEYLITSKTFKKVSTNKYTKGGLQYHRIRKGDSLSKIAQQYRTTVASLRKKNNLSANAVLRVGSSIRL